REILAKDSIYINLIFRKPKYNFFNGRFQQLVFRNVPYLCFTYCIPFIGNNAGVWLLFQIIAIQANDPKINCIAETIYHICTRSYWPACFVTGQIPIGKNEDFWLI